MNEEINTLPTKSTLNNQFRKNFPIKSTLGILLLLSTTPTLAQQTKITQANYYSPIEENNTLFDTENFAKTINYVAAYGHEDIKKLFKNKHSVLDCNLIIDINNNQKYNDNIDDFQKLMIDLGMGVHITMRFNNTITTPNNIEGHEYYTLLAEAAQSHGLATKTTDQGLFIGPVSSIENLLKYYPAYKANDQVMQYLETQLPAKK